MLLFIATSSFLLLFVVVSSFLLLFVATLSFLLFFAVSLSFLLLICLLRRVFCCYLLLRTAQKSLFSFVVQRLLLLFVAQILLFPFSLCRGYYSLLLHICSSHMVDIYQHHDNSSTKKKECKKRGSHEV